VDVTPDAGPEDVLDLTPRERPDRVARRRWPAVTVLVVLVAGLAFVLSQAIGDATVFFLNADEAVAQREDIGDRRFRLQGMVEADTVERSAEGVTFRVAYNGVEVDVEHRGDPPDLFQPGIPVVLEGAWGTTSVGPTFQSDRMLVKHDETYVADNGERLDDAETGGQVPVSTP
jgi:cytochrome c-type biogenesis protein CcmE